MTSVEVFAILLGLVFGYLIVSHFTGPKVPPGAGTPGEPGEEKASHEKGN